MPTKVTKRSATLIDRIYRTYGCLLYADDILLVSHSVSDMQAMLDLCSQEAGALDFTVNAKKYVVLRIHPRYNQASASLTLSGETLSYVDQCKYLGVVLTSFKYFKCSFDHVKSKFYRCFNTVFYRSKNAGSELVSVQLMQLICVPVLIYSHEVLQPNKTTINMFNHLIDRAVWKIFRCVDRDNIVCIRQSVHLPDVADCISLKFHKFKVQFCETFTFAEVVCNVLTS